jgi:hypothetical protein
MKSAFEVAMEKAAKLGKVSDEEAAQWKYIPEGEKLAAGYLRDERNLITELARYDEDARKFVVKGATEILLRNISIPRSDFVKKNTKRAMEGVKVLKRDKVGVENVFSKIRRILNHYQREGEQQRKQAYAALKEDFQVRVRQAVQQQLGTSVGIKMDVEKHPQFQEKWQKTLAQLDSQYFKLLDEYRKELEEIG